MHTIGFIGLGVMGRPMARNLLNGGFALRAYDVNPDALAAVDDALPVGSPAEAAEGADAVITMLPNGPDVEAAVFGANGIAETLSSEAMLIDMSTVAPPATDAIGARLVERGLTMLDAPVGRTSAHAEAGKLLIMVGGEAETLERARPAFACLGDTIVHCGPLGSGSRTKLVNNFLSIAADVVTAEALALAEASGLDVAATIEVLLVTTAGQGHLATTYPAKVLKGDLTPGFMIDLAHKDLGLGLDYAARLRVPVPAAAAARQTLTLAQAEGRGREDWTAVLETVRGMARLGRDAP